MSVKKRIQHRLEYAIFRFIEWKITIMPEWAMRPFANFLAFLVYDLFKYRRKVSLENLARAFPEKSPEEREKIARGCYRHWALTALEFFKMGRWTVEKIKTRVEFNDQALADKLKNSSRGAVIVSAHFGNWEIALAWLASQYFDGGSVIQLRQSNRLVDKRTADLRRRWGVEILYPRGAVRKALPIVQEHKFLGLLGDQDGGRKGVFVPFFGQPASTPVGAAVMHLRSQAMLIFGVCVRTAPFKYKIYVSTPEFGNLTEVNQENVAKITAWFTGELEKLVREYPEQYLWMHRRWKTVCTSSQEEQNSKSQNPNFK